MMPDGNNSFIQFGSYFHRTQVDYVLMIKGVNQVLNLNIISELQI